MNPRPHVCDAVLEPPQPELGLKLDDWRCHPKLYFNFFCFQALCSIFKSSTKPSSESFFFCWIFLLSFLSELRKLNRGIVEMLHSFFCSSLSFASRPLVSIRNLLTQFFKVHNNQAVLFSTALLDHSGMLGFDSMRLSECPRYFFEISAFLSNLDSTPKS